MQPDGTTGTYHGKYQAFVSTILTQIQIWDKFGTKLDESGADVAF